MEHEPERAMVEVVRLFVRMPESGEEEPLVSVIIPLSEREAEPAVLIESLPGDFEIILARGGTRASSMNRAAASARGSHLWFIHADTALPPGAVQALRTKVTAKPDALLYFNLRFDRGALMRVTELGVWFRSRVLGIPFGDQAFCLSAAAFRQLGGYNETATFGEDHLLVRQARRKGVPVRPVGASVITSARKYHEQGWVRTTWTHLRLTLRQALHGRKSIPDQRATDRSREL